MAQGDLTLFEEFSQEVLISTHNLGAGGDDIKVALIDSLPTASQVTPTLASFTQVVGTGYTAGGESILTGQSVTVVSGATYKWDSTDNPSWTQNGAGPTDIIAALIYNDTDGSNKAIGYIDMTVDSGTTPISLQAGNISITWNASGIMTIG